MPKLLFILKSTAKSLANKTKSIKMKEHTKNCNLKKTLVPTTFITVKKAKKGKIL